MRHCKPSSSAIVLFRRTMKLVKWQKYLHVHDIERGEGKKVNGVHFFARDVEALMHKHFIIHGGKKNYKN